MKRSILHFDLDTFFVSCERLMDSRLNNKPILVGGTGNRGVVSACSYEARAFGVQSGMPMNYARMLCPEAIVIKGHAGVYAKHSKVVTDIIKESVPLVEKASIDEFYADMTGMDKHFGCYQYAKELRTKIIKESGLPISFGLSENKTVSKVATEQAKPNNQLRIDYGNEKDFLAPLSIQKIPMVGEKTFKKFRDLGIVTIGTVQKMNIELMQNVFGKNGIKIWEKANGIDKTPVTPYVGRESISTERTYGRDTADINKLTTTIIAMTENLAFQLRRAQKTTACVSVKIRYADFKTTSKQLKITETNTDKDLIPLALNLFNILYNRRVQIRLIGVNFSHLKDVSQLNLFDSDTTNKRLYSAVDKLRDKYGDRCVIKASGMNARTIGRFNPFTGEPTVVLAHRTA